MKAVLTFFRVFLAIAVGAGAFFIGLFLPLWTLMLAGRDPGNTAGGLLTIGIGGPIGLLSGLAAGYFAFTRAGSFGNR